MGGLSGQGKSKFVEYLFKDRKDIKNIYLLNAYKDDFKAVNCKRINDTNDILALLSEHSEGIQGHSRSDNECRYIIIDEMLELAVREKKIMKEMVRALSCARHSNIWTMMLTLTYREDVSVEESKLDICKFNKQLRLIYPKCKYLYVIELTKRGRPHYHMLVDIPKNITDIKAYERYLAEIWGKGFIDVQIVNNSDRVGYYLSKYFTKDPIDTSCKLYGYSRNCDKPTVVKFLDSRDSVEILKEIGKEVKYTNSYEIDYTKNQVNYFVMEGLDNEDTK